MSRLRVSLAVAEQILLSRPEKYVISKLPWLRTACRCVRFVETNGIKYLMICGRPLDHQGDHEDVDEGVWWRNEREVKKKLTQSSKMKSA